MKRLLAALLLLAACSSEQKPVATETAANTTTTPPTVEQARELIASSAELGEHQFTNAGFTTPVASTSMSEPVRTSVRELAAAGWLGVDGTGNVVLTDKSRSDKRFLLRSNGLLDIIPLAKKEMGQVREVRAQPDGSVTAPFTWRWIANEVGSAFKSGAIHDRYAAEQESTATLMWDGTNWMVLKIE